MKACYAIREGALVSCAPEEASVIVYAAPTADEKTKLIASLGLDHHSLESALDPDEISRIDVSPDNTYIIWKRPNNVSFEQQLKFEVSSVGLYFQHNTLTVILGDTRISFDDKIVAHAGTLNSVMLRFFLQTVHHYLDHLKAIKMITTEVQRKLNVSIKNRYFLQMFALSESLVYYLNAIEANTAVLAKMKSCADRMGFSKDELAMLDDILIEYQQCGRQTQIYSQVLSGLMDARGTIINNNMNVLLKNLTLINVVFLPLNLVAGIGGMSEFTALTQNLDWRLAYTLFFVAMAVLGWLTWYIIVKNIEKSHRRG